MEALNQDTKYKLLSQKTYHFRNFKGAKVGNTMDRIVSREMKEEMVERSGSKGTITDIQMILIQKETWEGGIQEE